MCCCSRRISYLVSVDVVESIQQHLHHLLDLREGELHVSIAEQARQVMLTEVKYQVYAALVSVELGGWGKERAVKNLLSEPLFIYIYIIGGWWHTHIFYLSFYRSQSSWQHSHVWEAVESWFLEEQWWGTAEKNGEWGMTTPSSPHSDWLMPPLCTYFCSTW